MLANVFTPGRIVKATAVSALAAAFGLSTMTAASVSAGHEHALVTPGNECVVLAPETSGEPWVDLSDTGAWDHNPNIHQDHAEERQHPLHVLVHMGAPGGNGGPLAEDGDGPVRIGVHGSICADDE